MRRNQGRGTPKGAVRDYFLRIVLSYDGDDCLFWPFNRNSGGYALIKIDGKSLSVSRLACVEVNGPPPTSKHEAAHSCGKGKAGCVNPGHLSWKTAKGNQADRVAHGTHNRGSRNGRAKLSEADVLEIRASSGNIPIKTLCAKFGVSDFTIRQVQSGDRWKCVGGYA